MSTVGIMFRKDEQGFLVQLRHPVRGYAVRCSRCRWRGYRNGLQCECYDEYAWYCRPWVPGPGCPSGILWPCPQCCWPFDVKHLPRRKDVRAPDPLAGPDFRSAVKRPYAWWWFYT